MKECTHCKVGYATYAESGTLVNFCPKCGLKLSVSDLTGKELEAATKKAVEIKGVHGRCPRCGIGNTEQDFCTGCGLRLVAAKPAPAVAAEKS